MNAGDHFRAGRLQAAIDAQLAEVKAAPGDYNRRLFLFELSAFAGDLDRAKRQIEMLTFDTPELQIAAGVYRLALDSEEARRAFFEKGQPPQFFAPPPDHMTKRLEAMSELRSGRAADAAKLLYAANEAAPAISGELNGKEFDGLRDGDDLFGSVVEVFNNGRYFWLPLELIASVALNAPKSPRDLLWAPARVTLKDGTTGDVLLPAIYPGSHAHADDAIKLGRSTDWVTPAEGLTRGVGAKTFLVGDDAAGLLDWRELLIL
jgi:type VI secretion system protein ImpE